MCNEDVGKTTDYLNVRMIGLSPRILGCLDVNQIITIGELKQKSDKELLMIFGIGQGSIEEIHKKLDEFDKDYKGPFCDVLPDDTGVLASDVRRKNHPYAKSIYVYEQDAEDMDADEQDVEDSYYEDLGDIELDANELDTIEHDADEPEADGLNVKELDSEDLDAIELDAKNMSICHMGLSCGAFNCLCRAGYTTLGQLMTLTEEKLMKIPGMDEDLITDIHNTVLRMLRIIENEDMTEEYNECLKDPYRIYKGKLIHDVPLEELDLTSRAKSCLSSKGIRSLSDICWRTEEDLLMIRNLGKITFDEIMGVVHEKLDELAVKQNEEQ